MRSVKYFSPQKPTSSPLNGPKRLLKKTLFKKEIHTLSVEGRCFVQSLVSTYVVCERLSVMHEPAGVVENLVQILQFTPIMQYRIPPPPPKMKIVRNLGTLTFQLQNTSPPQKIEI